MTGIELVVVWLSAVALGFLAANDLEKRIDRRIRKRFNWPQEDDE